MTLRRESDPPMDQGEARFRALSQASADVLYRMSADWSELRELDGRGFLLDAVEVGEWLHRYIHADDQPGIMAAIGDALRERRTFELEHRVLRADGTFGWTLSRAVPLLDANGDVVEWIGTARDVTGQHEALDALRASEEKYRDIFDSIDEGFATIQVIHDASGRAVDLRYIETNRAFTLQSGVPAAAGRLASELLPSVDQAWLDTCSRVARTGEAARYEIHAAALDRWYDAHFSRVGGEGSAIVATVFRDITARRHAESRLQASEARQLFLLELSDDLRGLSDASEMQKVAMSELGRRLGVNRAVYFAVEPDGQSVRIGPEYRDGVPPLPEMMRLADFGAFTTSAYRRGDAIVISDVSADHRFGVAELAAFAAVPVRAAIGVPLHSGGELVAITGVLCVERREWSHADVALVREVAERTWAACERTRTEDALRVSETRSAFLLALSDALRPVSEPGEIEEVAMRVLAHQFGDVCAHYWNVDPDGGGLTLAGSCTNGPSLLSTRITREAFGARPVALLRGGRTIVMADVTTDELMDDGERARCADAQIGSGIAVPLVKDGSLVGVLAVHRATAFAWSRHDVAIVEDAAERTWGAIERARAESLLRASEEQFRRSIEDAPIPVIMHAEDGEVLEVSRSWTDLTGYALGDMHTFDDWLTRAYGEGADSVRSHVHDLFAGREQASSVEFPVVTRSGETRRWSFSASAPGALRDGRRFVVGMALDITDRLLAEQVRLRDALRRELAAAEEAERRRIARELHDQLGQNLTAFALGLDDASRLAGAGAAGAEALAARIAALQLIARELTTGARYIALELRPPELDDNGLEDAVGSYTREWSERYGVPVELLVRSGSSMPMPDSVATAMYRITQEALTNVAKHAGARQVSVILEHDAGEARLIIEDDGTGFEVDATLVRARGERRLGLAGVQERVSLAGGTLRVESSPGRGTTLFIQLPVTQDTP